MPADDITVERDPTPIDDPLETRVKEASDLPLWVRVLDRIRVIIDAIAEAGGWLAARLIIVIFVIGILNVILRYYGRAIGETLVTNLWIDLQWQIYALLFLIGFPYGVKHQLNPRVDFWHVNFTKRRKAWLDLILHSVLLVPFTVLAMRVVWPFAITAMGRRFDGSWPTWKVWEIWDVSINPDGLPVGPIKMMLLVGFVLLGLQAIAEIIRNLMVLLGHDEVLVADFDPEIRVE